MQIALKIATLVLTITPQGTAADRTACERVTKPAPDGSQWSVEPQGRGFALTRRAPGQPLWTAPLATPARARKFPHPIQGAALTPQPAAQARVLGPLDELWRR